MAGPTKFPDLNELLLDFTGGVQEVLGDKFVGAYLQGSFAVGDADEHSDVDFIVVTEGEPTHEQVAMLQAMHQRLYARETPWAQHLEGSCVARGLVRRVDPARTPLWYLDNGATELVRDNHCNTAVVRWSLHEHGVRLAGPAPRKLVDAVAPEDLRAEVSIALNEWADWAKATPAMSRRAQNLMVVSVCRILHTIETGSVATKREAGEWAVGALPDHWLGLIREALADRPDPWAKVRQPASPAAVERTLAFVDYALSRAVA